MGLRGQPHDLWAVGVPHLKIQDGACGTHQIIKLAAIKVAHLGWVLD